MNRKIKIALVFAIGLAIVQVSAAFAHPLGNFTVNRYAGIVVQPNAINVDYVVDMAEIPAYQEIQQQIGLANDGTPNKLAADNYRASKCAEFPSNFALTLNGRALAISIDSTSVEFPPGAGGLLTLRLTCDYHADLASLTTPNAIAFRDRNFADRIGWREIVARGDGASIHNSNVGSTGISNRLMNYPNDLLSNPPNQTEAHFQFDLTAAQNPEEAFAINRVNTLDRTQDALASLIATNDTNIPLMALALALAIGLGAAHAVSPGHGKTIMAAYLVGTRGNFKQAILLGMTVTITHTLGVITLGVITLFASRYILPESLYPWLSLVSGVLVIGMGAALVWNRWQDLQHEHFQTSNDDHAHEHHHGLVPHTHAHMPQSSETALTWKNLVGLGLVGGIVPSASALILLLSAISLQRIAFGIVLIVAFGMGMALVLVGIGVLLVRASSLLERRRAPTQFTRMLPLFSAIIVIGAGIIVAIEALLQMGMFKQ